jgi:triacylglycerol lipase
MALARLQQGVVVAVLLIALAWLAFWGLAGRPGVAVGGALALLFPHALVMATEFSWAAAVNRLSASRTVAGANTTAVPPPPGGEVVRAWAAEVVTAVRVFGWQQPFRHRAEPDHLPADSVGRTAVLLVHGFVCNRGFWNRWMRRLRAEGVPFVAVSLEPVFGDIDTLAPQLTPAVHAVLRATGRPPLIVAHSMGGLVVRAWLRQVHGQMHGQMPADPELVQAAAALRVVTLGTPHHGTRLGDLGQSPSAVQMRLSSDWLQALAASEHTRQPSPYRGWTCFWSTCDNIVFPASTATLAGAHAWHVAGRAHVDLTDAPEVLAEVLRQAQTG